MPSDAVNASHGLGERRGSIALFGNQRIIDLGTRYAREYTNRLYMCTYTGVMRAAPGRLRFFRGGVGNHSVTSHLAFRVGTFHGLFREKQRAVGMLDPLRDIIEGVFVPGEGGVPLCPRLVKRSPSVKLLSYDA